MKEIELTVLNRDIDAVIEYLGSRGLIHISADKEDSNSATVKNGKIKENLDKLASSAAWLGVILPDEPMESSRFPGEAEDLLAAKITGAVSSLSSRQNECREEKQKIEETLNEARAFANLNAPFSDLDQLSYLTLRAGRLDPLKQEELRKNLSGRAVVIPLGEGSESKVLTASSRKGRFALDSELKRLGFAPIDIPQGYKGIPAELLSSLEERLKKAEKELEEIELSRNTLGKEYGESLQSLTASYLMAEIAGKLKARLVSTDNVCILSGWVPSEQVHSMVDALEKITAGRIAVRSYNPDEIEKVREGKEKVPVSLNHGAYVGGFQNVVFSYGAPLYGTVDPTPFVAVSFTVLFGIMFGDFGQGLVLLLLGILTGKKGPAFLARFRRFSVPLMAVGISSMVMGFLAGSFFTNETILAAPTRALSGFLTGHPVDRILTIMPLAEKGGSIIKLALFFGFTVALGVFLNSAGFIVNTINLFIMKKYEKALFDKTGLAGILLFWYALFIGIRFAVSLLMSGIYFAFQWFDIAGLLVPLLGIFFGPAIWRFVSGERPVFEEGAVVYIVEGIVQIIETVSGFISNTVSFLRVGAFALSHAVLAYIVFRFSEEVNALAAGPLFSLIILIFGNLVIICLEGIIVAIQVIRLQYYEFFSKFFTETGVEFSPFRFRKSVEQRNIK